MKPRSASAAAVALAGVLAMMLHARVLTAATQAAPVPALSAMRAGGAGAFLRRVLNSIESGSLIGGARRHAGQPSAQEICEGLACQCGCGLTVANCNHPSCGFSVPARGEIEGMIRAGMTRAGVISAFRHQYGEKVLSAPTTEGFNLLAWIAPFAVLLAGAIAIFLAAARWRSAAPARGRDIAPAARFDPRLRALLERELRDQI